MIVVPLWTIIWARFTRQLQIYNEHRYVRLRISMECFFFCGALYRGWDHQEVIVGLTGLDMPNLVRCEVAFLA